MTYDVSRSIGSFAQYRVLSALATFSRGQASRIEGLDVGELTGHSDRLAPAIQQFHHLRRITLSVPPLKAPERPANTPLADDEIWTLFAQTDRDEVISRLCQSARRLHIRCIGDTTVVYYTTGLDGDYSHEKWYIVRIDRLFFAMVSSYFVYSPIPLPSHDES